MAPDEDPTPEESSHVMDRDIKLLLSHEKSAVVEDMVVES